MVMMSINLPEMIENEWYLVRHSGETPEIAFHSAIYHLTQDCKGPLICLDNRQITLLLDAAVARFFEIIVRDLLHENSTTPAYRGISRSIVNYRRFCNFCQRQQRDWPEVNKKTAAVLRSFLEKECEAVKNNDRASIINCTFEELRQFATELGVESEFCLKTVEKLCAEDESTTFFSTHSLKRS